jgi:hypothetical protein
VIVFPLFYVADLNSGEKELVNSVGIFCAIFATMCSLYGYKVILLVQGYDYDVLLQLSKKGKRAAVSSTVQPTETPELSMTQPVEKKFGVSNLNPFDAVKTKNLLGRREVCREQVPHIHIYMYMYIYLCIYIYICMYIYMYLYMYIFIYIYIYMYVYIRPRICWVVVKCAESRYTYE